MRFALNAFLRENEARAYALGTWDCALYAFGAVEAQSGVDHLKAYRGKYANHRQAHRLLRKVDGVRDVLELADKKLGARIPPAMARTGDVVAYQDSLGVLYSNYAVFLGEVSGYVRVPRSKVTAAWSFPRVIP